MITVNNVSKKYGDFCALDAVNFSIDTGDFVGLLGVNGAGKTTLISSMSGTNNFTGSIHIMGYDVSKQSVYAKKSIGVVPQELAFDPFLTVRTTLEFQSSLYGIPDTKSQRAWIDYILKRLYLYDKINSMTRGLSGGMKRRLMVAQALVHKPPVIILDEPTAGVDVEIRQYLWQFIKELHQEGHTILLTTHYLEEVEQLCNTILMINKGKILNKSSKLDIVNQARMMPFSVEVIISGDVIEHKDVNAYFEHYRLLLPENLFSMLEHSNETNTLGFKLDSSIQLPMLLSQLQEANFVVNDIHIHRPSLENVFMNYLKHENNES